VFRRLRILVVIAIWAVLIPSPAHAERCDARCAAYVQAEVKLWNDARQVTLFRQWIGDIVASWPAAQCVAEHESHFSYFAENAVSTASGKYQFLDGTWSNVALARGRPDLVGHASAAPTWEQDASFGWAWTHGLQSAWNGTHCN
jgi:hypothetical protein